MPLRLSNTLQINYAHHALMKPNRKIQTTRFIWKYNQKEGSCWENEWKIHATLLH